MDNSTLLYEILGRLYAQCYQTQSLLTVAHKNVEELTKQHSVLQSEIEKLQRIQVDASTSSQSADK